MRAEIGCLLLVVAVLRVGAARQARADEVIRGQLSGPFIKCDEWISVRKGDMPRRAELEAFVRGYAEGVAAHVKRPPGQGPFSFDDFYGKIDRYCADYADFLQAAVETTLEKTWPDAGAKLLGDGPAPRNSYIAVPKDAK